MSNPTSTTSGQLGSSTMESTLSGSPQSPVAGTSEDLLRTYLPLLLQQFELLVSQLGRSLKQIQEQLELNRISRR